MSPPVDEQLRLLLERRCSETGRELAQTLKSAEIFLAMFDLGEAGNLAWFGTADMVLTRAAVARWVETGTVEGIRVASEEEAERLADAMKAIGDEVRDACLPGAGFALLLFTTERALAYVSNGNREDVREGLREWLGRDGGREVAEA
jgi:hypothetical protein